MILRHPLLLFILSLISTFLISPASAHTLAPPPPHGPIPPTPPSLAPSLDSRAAGDLICRPFGECEPCPPDELSQPFCMPYGNRRLLHCRRPDHTGAGSKDDGTKTGTGAGGGAGEIPAWEACGKVVKSERQDFWEFVTCNLLFLIVALTILWTRTSALASQQYRQLAARIGIAGTGWRT